MTTMVDRGKWNRRAPGSEPPKTGHQEGLAMSDLIYVGMVVAFFVVSGLYVRFCDKL